MDSIHGLAAIEGDKLQFEFEVDQDVSELTFETIEFNMAGFAG